MARLYGERKSPLPVLIGVALLALVGIGGYYMYQNRGADAVTIVPGEVNMVNNSPGNMVSKGNVDAERNGNTVTVGSGTENANDAAGNSASGSADADGANNADNPSNTDMSGHSSAPSGATEAANSASGNSANGGNGTTAGSETASTEESGARERSKTITNNKTGTTVTYKKKVSEDDSVTREKTQTGAASPSTPSNR